MQALWTPCPHGCENCERVSIQINICKAVPVDHLAASFSKHSTVAHVLDALDGWLSEQIYSNAFSSWMVYAGPADLQDGNLFKALLANPQQLLSDRLQELKPPTCTCLCVNLWLCGIRKTLPNKNAGKLLLQCDRVEPKQFKVACFYRALAKLDISVWLALKHYVDDPSDLIEPKVDHRTTIRRYVASQLVWNDCQGIGLANVGGPLLIKTCKALKRFRGLCKFAKDCFDETIGAIEGLCDALEQECGTRDLQRFSNFDSKTFIQDCKRQISPCHELSIEQVLSTIETKKKRKPKKKPKPVLGPGPPKSVQDPGPEPVARERIKLSYEAFAALQGYARQKLANKL